MLESPKESLQFLLQLQTQRSAYFLRENSEAVTGGENIMILSDFPVHTNWFMKVYKPDIAVKDRNNKIYLLIDMSIPYLVVILYFIITTY